MVFLMESFQTRSTLSRNYNDMYTTSISKPLYDSFGYRDTRLTDKPNFTPINKFDFKPTKKEWSLEDLQSVIADSTNIVLEL